MKPSEDPQASQPDPMTLLKQQAEAGSCGEGCSCNCGSSPCAGKARWLIGVVILIVAGALVARALTKTDNPTSAASDNGFAIPAASAEAPVDTPAPPAEDSASAKAASASESTSAGVGTMIGKFEDLNLAAAASDAVFVYLPGNNKDANIPALSTFLNAANTIKSKTGAKVAIFTLRPGSEDYQLLMTQVSIPGVLALVKGKGMSALSGEVTENKLLQSYVSASSAGGCGSGGCGPAAPGCN